MLTLTLQHTINWNYHCADSKMLTPFNGTVMNCSCILATATLQYISCNTCSL